MSRQQQFTKLDDCKFCDHQRFQHSDKKGMPCMIGTVVGNACHCIGWEKK